MSLEHIRGWLIDLDGVMYRGETVVEGAAGFVTTLRAAGTPFLFLTNNSSRTQEQYARRLQSMGIPAKPEEFFTSALATAEYLARRAPAGSRVLMIGMDGLREALEKAGFVLVQDPAEAQYCVVGYDIHLTYKDLVRASTAIRAGAPFIGTNPDPTLPVEGGFVPGNGAILAALATATGVQPTVIGKPERIILDLALERLDLQPGECAILGDRLDTDIVGGKKAGLFTILILTGSTTAEEALRANERPDLIVKDFSELMKLWQARFV